MTRPGIRHLRVALLAAAGIALGTVVAVAPLKLTTPGASAASTAGGTITRSEVITRAQYWVDHQPGPYDEGGHGSDPQGQQYRTDCSGYISMAWHLQNQVNTVTLPTIATKITKDQLKPGDVLDAAYGAGSYTTGHVAMFAGWTSSAHDHYWGYEFGQTPVVYHSIPYPYFSNDPRTFVPYHYTKVVDDPAVGTTSAGAVLDSSGTEHTSVTTSTGLVYTVAGSGNDWTLSSRNNLNGSTPTGSGGENYFPASNRYSLFSIGGGSLYQKNYSGGTWDSSWKNIGGTTVTGGVAAMVDKDNHQHLYVTTSNGTVYSVATNNGWHWSTIPGITAHGTPAIDYNPATGTYHLYVISNGTLYENTNTGTGWNTHWTKIGGTTLTGGLAAVIDKTGHQHIFAINGDHDLYSVVNNNGWNWTNHGGGHLTGTPKVLYNPTTDYYDIFIASNGTLVHKEYIHGAWQGSYHTIAGTNITD